MTVFNDTLGTYIFCLNDKGLPISDVLLAGTLFYVKQNNPLGLHVKHTGG
jgi:hypothetical protein